MSYLNFLTNKIQTEVQVKRLNTPNLSTIPPPLTFRVHHENPLPTIILIANLVPFFQSRYSIQFIARNVFEAFIAVPAVSYVPTEKLSLKIRVIAIKAGLRQKARLYIAVHWVDVQRFQLKIEAVVDRRLENCEVVVVWVAV